ncbi:MAG: hypothetical protein NVS9B12_11870 [Vulcanimicrobiaceae bacterium]
MPTHDPSSTAAVQAALATFGIFIWLFVLVAVGFSLFVYWRIATKAGFSGWMSLLMFVPVANFVILLIFAFSEWPIEQELNRLRAGAANPAAPGSAVMTT